MRIRKYKIDAVHSILRRIIKSNLNKEELDSIMTELHSLGYEYEDMKIDILSEISLTETDDDILDNEERVIKYLMIENKWSEEKAKEYLKPIFFAMKKAHAVFYRP